MSNSQSRSIHLHLVSDATGETLISISKAVMAQYEGITAQEHTHMLVRSTRQMNRALEKIELQPGIVLHTVVNMKLVAELEKRCNQLKVPAIPVLDGIIKTFDQYLGAAHKPTISGQHALDASYFRRIDALNFTMEHDDAVCQIMSMTLTSCCSAYRAPLKRQLVSIWRNVATRRPMCLWCRHYRFQKHSRNHTMLSLCV